MLYERGNLCDFHNDIYFPPTIINASLLSTHDYKRVHRSKVPLQAEINKIIFCRGDYRDNRKLLRLPRGLGGGDEVAGTIWISAWRRI